MNYPILKGILTRIGGRLSGRSIHLLNGVFNYLYAGWWMRQRGLQIPTRDATREELYRSVIARISEPVTYLEFGVFEGASIRYWSTLLTHSETVLHGFDSFEGLPENWRMAADRNVFNVGGRLPQVDDRRVSFFQGWFQDSLPVYLKDSPPRTPLIVHLDADLYSSTKYVLTQLRVYLGPGTVLLFDEFFDREHELKALEEYLEETKTRIECIGTTRTLTQAAFRILENDSGASPQA